MKSTAHIQGHPIHPMLIPYPFALLSGAVAFDVGAAVTGRTSWAQTAANMSAAGLGTALVAAVPGIVDYFGSIPPRSRSRRYATAHALFNVSALVCFSIAGRTRDREGRLPTRGLTLGLLGTALLGAGGWLGGELVYHEHVAVVENVGGNMPTRIE